MYMMSAAWAALAIVLSGLGALYTWWAWRRRGLPALVRGTAITLLPIAMWLTGTLRLFAVTADWLAGWATSLVFSPTVIVGTVLALVSAALFGLAGRLGAGTPRAGRTQVGRTPSAPGIPGSSATKPARKPGRAKAAAPADDDLDDIEALLRKRGIS